MPHATDRQLSLDRRLEAEDEVVDRFVGVLEDEVEGQLLPTRCYLTEGWCVQHAIRTICDPQSEGKNSIRKAFNIRLLQI